MNELVSRRVFREVKRYVDSVPGHEFDGGRIAYVVLFAHVYVDIVIEHGVWTPE